MSELKSVKQSDVMWGHWFTEYYLKTEADKVIAEKDTKIIQLEAFIENYNRISREIIDNAFNDILGRDFGKSFTGHPEKD